MIDLKNLYVKVYQLNGDYRDTYKVIAAMLDSQKEDYFFAFIDDGKLNWFVPNSLFRLECQIG